MSSFSFLKSEWPDVCEAAEKAAVAVYPDPRAACFLVRFSFNKTESPPLF